MVLFERSQPVQRLITSFVFLGALWTAGFIWFLAALPNQAPTTNEVDGVVVLTGGGERISTGMSLVETGIGKRLLISGVNPKISREEIATLWPGDNAAFECCADLGIEAQSTEQNADETRSWLRQHQYSRVILVTSEYHMPRAMLEMRDASPEKEFIPYPVRSVFLNEKGRPTTLKAWRLLAKEYTKFIAVRIKTIVT